MRHIIVRILLVHFFNSEKGVDSRSGPKNRGDKLLYLVIIIIIYYHDSRKNPLSDAKKA